MFTNYSENIIDEKFFKLMKMDGSLVINLKENNNVLISSWLNGGIKHNLTNIVNLTVESGDYADLADAKYDVFQKNKFISLGLDYENTAGLLTSACMDNYSVSVKKYEKLKVTAVVTAGADKNAVKAGDAASFYEYDNTYFNTFGTINIMVIIDANLEDGALVTASITATEAKTAVLRDLKIESQYSTGLATGTGTDGIAIISNKNSTNHIENAGKHSKLGELIAKSVMEATKEALYLQTFMSSEFQSTVLSRFSRFNITFDDFYSEVSIDKTVYASKFYQFNKNKENVAFVSSIINLIDEINVGLLNLDDAVKIVKNMIELHLDVKIEEKIENVNDILDLLIKSINHHLLD